MYKLLRDGVNGYHAGEEVGVLSINTDYALIYKPNLASCIPIVVKREMIEFTGDTDSEA